MERQHVSFISHPCQLEHGLSSHPENAQRLQAIFDEFSTSPYKLFMDLFLSRLATKEELALVHSASYIDSILKLEGQNIALDYETHLTSGSVQAALSAAGMGIELVEQVLTHKIQSGFALVRPPGHHARANKAMGFCIFNNIAIAAHKALSLGAKKIVILDWDVHHGNGTQEIFYEDDRVLFIDLHQENLFPQDSGLLEEIGKGKGLGFTVNIPLPPSSTDVDYFYIFDTLVKPLILNYQPELILVSAGFDAHESDPLGFMCLTTEGYGELTSKVKGLAEEVCGGKTIFFLEGGYNPYFLAKNVIKCAGSLVEEPAISSLDSTVISEPIKQLVNEVYALHFKS